MSDSDCSNCDKECKFRDYLYDCYVRQVKDIKNAFSKEDGLVFKKAIEVLTRDNELNSDEVDITKSHLQNIIEMIDEEL